jgi:hypothetical protein
VNERLNRLASLKAAAAAAAMSKASGNDSIGGGGGGGGSNGGCGMKGFSEVVNISGGIALFSADDVPYGAEIATDGITVVKSRRCLPRTKRECERALIKVRSSLS